MRCSPTSRMPTSRATEPTTRLPLPKCSRRMVVWVVIPSNPTRAKLRAYDRHLYRERCLVEHLFQRIKRFRRIAMRFEKLARNFLAFLHLAAALVWLR